MADSSIIKIDSLLTIDSTIADTAAVHVKAEMISETQQTTMYNGESSQPGGWTQLLLPLVIALLVVFLDKWVTRWYERKDAKVSRKHYRDTVLDWIDKIQPIEQTFRDSIQSLSKTIEESDDMLPQPYAMPLTMHDKLGVMTIEKMTDAFLRDFKNDKDKRFIHMYNILSNFEYLSKITNGVKESYNTYNKQAFRLCQEWNGLYEDLMAYFNRLHDVNPFSTIITGWMMELMDNPNSVAVHEKYLNMLNLVAVKEKDVDTFARINKLHRVVAQVQVLNKGFAKNFSDMASNIDLSLNSLNAAVKYFRESEK